MTLIKSISGIRGTIGGKPGDTLNPLDIVKFTSFVEAVKVRAIPLLLDVMDVFLATWFVTLCVEHLWVLAMMS